uniref:Uncharacterized protein n=1 Tax=Anguilla anguilla TaxID=7936 RepID=A0A0E9WQ06_ANGAN
MCSLLLLLALAYVTAFYCANMPAKYKAESIFNIKAHSNSILLYLINCN